MRARNGQHTPSQIHVVHHEARGGVAKVVVAAIRNTLLCNQHQVHHSDAQRTSFAPLQVYSAGRDKAPNQSPAIAKANTNNHRRGTSVLLAGKKERQ
ncbi:ATP-dependent DEAD/H RNA helicase [Trypanosoma cruzi Dm28c]|uniref:ATP-dependent DEAD/H RNA helicase n=1 Tax=Trypanosoma cruzi Dm28c TaxID=1416333 RepID=V5B3P0_TRYCR|nr:ATP-dependent DEAD/H RNA helicase [Trypanosoma cruzi Dm28c]